MYQLTANFHLRYLQKENLWITVSSADGERISGLRFYETDPRNKKKYADVCEKAIKQIEKYFDGAPTNFAGLVAPNTYEEWLKTLGEVPYGKTITYKEFAEMHGSPKAWIAAGNACEANPIPLIIPCHRVVNSGNLIGSYVGFEEYEERQDPRNLLLKLALIHHEQRNLAIMHAKEIAMRANAIKKALD